MPGDIPPACRLLWACYASISRRLEYLIPGILLIAGIRLAQRHSTDSTQYTSIYRTTNIWFFKAGVIDLSPSPLCIY